MWMCRRRVVKSGGARFTVAGVRVMVIFPSLFINLYFPSFPHSVTLKSNLSFEGELDMIHFNSCVGVRVCFQHLYHQLSR